MVWIYFVKKKSDIFTKFIEFKKMVENQCNRKIKMLRSDGGTEYMSNEFDKFLIENGIKGKSHLDTLLKLMEL